MIRHDIKGHDGVNLAVFEGGNPDGPPILLIHGWSQHHLCWSRQMTGPLAERFRLIAPDLRGHGASDKPDSAESYNNSAPWAGDFDAIIKALDLNNPLIVGWSMGGWVLNDYIRVHGDADISGLCLIGTAVATGQFAPREAWEMRMGDTDVKAEGMFSDDHEVALPSTIKFVKACVASPLDADDLALMVGYNMMCPPHVRHASRMRQEDWQPSAAKMTKPALILWGTHERLAPKPMADQALATIPNSRELVFENSGHAPFWEEAARFNADLLAFAQTCFQDEMETST